MASGGILLCFLLVSFNQLMRVESLDPMKLVLYGTTLNGLGPFGMPTDQYKMPVALGTGGRRLDISFDTNFNDMFVPAQGSGHHPLHYDKGFDPSGSTWKVTGSVQYIYTILTGNWYADFVSIRDNKQFQSNFLVATGSNYDLGYQSWDGVFGLGPKPQNLGNYPNLITNLQQQGLIQLAQFGLWFSPPADSVKKFELTLGGMDPHRAINMQAFKPQSYQFGYSWWIPLSPVSLGSTNIGCTNRACSAIIHTGISDIIGPRDQVNQIYATLGLYPGADGRTFVNCNMLREPYLSFTFEGQKRALPSSHFVKRLQSHPDICYVTIYPNDSQDQWILGTNFLAAYYVAIDTKRNTILMAK